MPLIAAVGDLTVNRPEPDSIFDGVRHVITDADISFAQLESPYSDKGSRGSSGPRGTMPKDVRNYPSIINAGFDVISLASNHGLDWGEDALLDLRDRLRTDGVHPVGFGRNLAEARRPVVLERDGTKIAFLAYCSVAPTSYYAVEARAGIAPMRAMVHYEPLEPDQPGTPAEIVTIPLQSDLDNLLADVRAAREQADLVVLSMHWGIHFARAVIADYQRIVAHAAIDEGVDLILGHHPHILKGIELYRGKVILYSLGNFAFDSVKEEKGRDVVWNERRMKLYREIYRMPERDPDSAYRFQSDSKYSMIAKIQVSDKTVARVSFLPVMIDKNATPQIVSPKDPEGQEVLGYIHAITREAGLNATFEVDGTEVIINGS